MLVFNNHYTNVFYRELSLSSRISSEQWLLHRSSNNVQRTVQLQQATDCDSATDAAMLSGVSFGLAALAAAAAAAILTGMLDVA